MLFSFAQEYSIRKVEYTNLGQEVKGTHQADNVNLIGDDIRTIEINKYL